MIGAIVLGIVAAAAVVWATQVLHEEVGLMPFVAGAAVFMARWCPELSLTWLAPVMFAIMICLSIWLIWWWHENGAELHEMLPFVGLAVVLYFATKTVASLTAGMVTSAFWASVIMWAVPAMLVLAIGLFITNYCLFHYEQEEGDGYRIGALLAGVVTLIIIIALAVNMIAWPHTDKAMAMTESDTMTEVVASDEAVTTGTVSNSNQWYFHNTELLYDGDSSNDFNFGPEPGNGSWTVADYEADYRETLRNDPAIGAADMAYHDAVLGTRFIGKFYDECSGKWDAAINAAKEAFIADPTLYHETLKQYFAFRDTGTTTVETRDSGLNDQMYMNPFTVTGIPDVIVMETDDHGGKFLVTTYVIKGSTSGIANAGEDAVINGARQFKTAYRISCGYQPTNVAEVMNITPQQKPTTPTTPSKPTQTTPTKPTQTTPTTPTTPTVPSYDKDPTKGTQGEVVAPNDNKGPGPNTNNGVGSTTSAKDKPTNSGNGMTYPEYREEVKEIKEVNQTQKTGNDNNTPSYTPPSSTVTTTDSTGKTTTTTTKPTVDNNGDKGNGSQSAPINNPTPATQSSARSAETNKPITNTESNPAGEWSGPPD